MEFTPQNAAKLNAEAGEAGAFPHRPVDLAHLSRYTKGNCVLEREVLEVFRHQTRAYFEKLRVAQQDTAWRDAASTLKTAARGVGAWQILHTAETAERLTMAPAQGVRDELLATLKGQIEDANAFISTVLE